MIRLIATSTMSLLLTAACDQGSKSAPAVPVPTAAAPAAPAAKEAAKPATAATQAAAEGAKTATGAQVHDVACGCVVENVGECGNMIKVEGKYLPLAGDLRLGPMEFCGKEGLQAEVAGEVKDGKFIASSFKLKDEK